MGLGGFIALLISSIHVGSKLLDEKAGNIEHDKWLKSYKEFSEYYNKVLVDRDLECVVERYLWRNLGHLSGGTYYVKLSKLKSKLCNTIGNEIDFITRGLDDDGIIMIGKRELTDLIMSRFGKLSRDTVSGWSRLGQTRKVSEDLYDYDITIRVYQCIESNLNNFGYEHDIILGVDKHEAESHSKKVPGKYPTAKVVLFGKSSGEFMRVFPKVDMPFTMLKIEDLKD